jgi:hypothetical protein
LTGLPNRELPLGLRQLFGAEFCRDP